MTTGTPMVSVVMSVHNGMAYLSEAVESILEQTFRDFEFIVVDDGSTDDSHRLLKRYAAEDARMLVIRQEKNSGVAEARNQAIARARGEFIASQDADDISLPERLEAQVAYLRQHPAVGLLGTWPEFVDAEAKPLEAARYPRISDNAGLQAQLLDTNCFCAGTVMVRRHLLETVGGYDQGLAPSEDYDLWLRLAEVTRLANVPRALYLYRQHPGSASRQSRHLQMRNKARALEHALARRFGQRPPAGLKQTLARDYMRAVFIGYRPLGAAGVAEDLAGALVWSPEIVSSGSLVEDVVEGYLQHEPVDEAIAVAESFFSDVLPGSAHLRRAGRRVLAKLHMRAVFEAQARGAHTPIGPHLWAGIRRDPAWLLNRGVWAIGVRQILHRSAP